jgi:hypothetical protein
MRNLLRSKWELLDAPDGAATPPTGFLGRSTRVLALAVTLAVIGLVGGSGAQAASAQTVTNEFGTLHTSKVTGHTANGATFTGKYHVTKFVTRNGHLKALGHLAGTLTKKSGATKAVSERVRMPVNMRATRAANTTSALPTTSSTAGTSAASCNVLHLVLGPLDLDLLGLVVHLDKVVLDITAVPGAGALLGNLLCAVVGLLDGTGIGGLSGILTNLLNAILGILQA